MRARRKPKSAHSAWCSNAVGCNTMAIVQLGDSMMTRFGIIHSAEQLIAGATALGAGPRRIDQRSAGDFPPALHSRHCPATRTMSPTIADSIEAGQLVLPIVG